MRDLNQSPIGRYRDVGAEVAFAGHPGDAFNGFFVVPGPVPGRRLKVIIGSDREWEHASVSVDGKTRHTPTWPEMCLVKDLVWLEEETVLQFHPPRAQYVNYHPGCLHLWRWLGGARPVPPPWMVGPMREDKP
jgi:hypothetical protein